MKLSLVTGTLNRPVGLERLIDSIEACTSVDWELVIADASETPYQSMNAKIRVLPEKPRLGCTRGYNQAFKACLGEFVLWLNDDCEVLRDYDTAAIRFMESNPRIGLGALHYCEPSTGKPEFHVNSAWGAMYANFGILRRDMGNQVGWMDEDLYMYGNDNSLAFRVLLAGKGVADIPAARLIHHSIQDRHRDENQRHRTKDSMILSDKYMPLRQKWQLAFTSNYVNSGSQPWPHGLRPELVAKR